MVSKLWVACSLGQIAKISRCTDSLQCAGQLVLTQLAGWAVLVAELACLPAWRASVHLQVHHVELCTGT